MSERHQPIGDPSLERGSLETGDLLSYAKATVVLLLCVATVAGIARSGLNTYATTAVLLTVIITVTFALRWQRVALSTATLLIYTAFTGWVVLGAAGWAGIL